ncbi:hypothetical protein FQR65_LT00658 [Abscondita terminalis]|nr:hypothetical protein FQR65_LT00658 [Abscondita terminalis]
MIYRILALAILMRFTASVTVVTLESQLSISRILPNRNDLNSFVRIQNNKVEVLNCPENFIFDFDQLKCVLDNNARRNNRLETVQCDENYAGTITNPKNCRTFIDCWYGLGYIIPCPDYLLFNNVTKQCDWPETAQCCEFWENDDSSLIVDV